MATTTTQKNDVVETPADVPGSYLGTDGNGWQHYYQMATRKVTVVDGDERKTFRVGRDQTLIEWAAATVRETGAHWQDIRLDSEAEAVLTGEISLAELKEVQA